MIYGVCRMIYLLCKYDIISVPSYAEGIYHRSQSDIIPKVLSLVPTGTDIIEKSHFCQVDKSDSFRGGPDRIRTDDPYNANVMRSQLRYRPIRIGSA